MNNQTTSLKNSAPKPNFMMSKKNTTKENINREINTCDNPNIRNEIIALKGSVIRFSNGCSLDATPEIGGFWGSNPYGQDWYCNQNGWVESVLQWLSYWDEPRDERGYLMNDQGG